MKGAKRSREPSTGPTAWGKGEAALEEGDAVADEAGRDEVGDVGAAGGAGEGEASAEEEGADGQPDDLDAADDDEEADDGVVDGDGGLGEDDQAAFGEAVGEGAGVGADEEPGDAVASHGEGDGGVVAAEVKGDDGEDGEVHREGHEGHHGEGPVEAEAADVEGLEGLADACADHVGEGTMRLCFVVAAPVQSFLLLLRHYRACCGNLAVPGTEVRLGRGEIPAASAGMTELMCAGVWFGRGEIPAASAGMTVLMRGYDGSHAPGGVVRGMLWVVFLSVVGLNRWMLIRRFGFGGRWGCTPLGRLHRSWWGS